MADELERAFELFGTRVRLLIGPPLGARPAELAALETEAMMRRIQAALSRFDPASELSRLNADAREAVAVTPLVAMLVDAIVAAGRRSGGLVDATVIEGLERAGYERSRSGLEPAPLAEALAKAPPRRPASADAEMRWRSLHLDRERGLLTRPPGVRIDSGGLGKGLAADLAAARLRDFESFAVDCGGDIRFGAGANVADRAIELANPLRPDEQLSFAARCGAVATSGLRTRIWRRGDGFAHHLIDPGSGAPAWTGVVQATAFARTGVEAEVLAKTAVLSGPRHGREVVRPRGGVLVLDDGSIDAVGPLAGVGTPVAAGAR
jgi:thiamine biosynthesis lipoprotein